MKKDNYVIRLKLSEHVKNYWILLIKKKLTKHFEIAA